MQNFLYNDNVYMFMIRLSKLPGYVQFETNTYCDQKCIFCTHGEIPTRKMSNEMIKQIIDETIPTAHTCCRNNTKRKRCNERESGGKKFKMGVVM